MNKYKNTLIERYRLQTITTRIIDYELNKIESGDIIMATPAYKIPFLYHYGMYVGDNKVIHVQDNRIAMDSIEYFCKDRTKIKIKKILPMPHEIEHAELFEQRKQIMVQTAKNMEGDEWKYNILSDNCESFTNWLITGKMFSQQSIIFRNTLIMSSATSIGYYIGKKGYSIQRLCKFFR